jgi:hypothetical protein
MLTLLITNEKNSTLISQKSQEKQNAYCSLNLCFKPILQILDENGKVNSIVQENHSHKYEPLKVIIIISYNLYYSLYF